MDSASRVMSAAMRASTNKTVINVFLVGAFVALSVRSLKQQRDIEALESEKDSILNSNKAVKKSMWNWKQQLFSEASSPDTAIVPLSKLKAIYGESPTALQPRAQATTPTFGSGGFGQAALGSQCGGRRVAAYTPIAELDCDSSIEPTGKLESISAMPFYKDKSHEELRWDDYQLGDKAGQSTGAI